MKKFVRKFVLAVVLAIVLLEVVLRLFGTDFGHRIEFFGISVETPYDKQHWNEVYTPYRSHDFWDSDSVYGGYDPDLGWTILPNRTTSNGLYHSNSQGIRGNREYALEPDSGVFRVAIFGDSFTHGNDVENDSTWPAQLEQILRAKGFNVEVMNFGVMSYGPDQAYLRYLKDGKQFHPDIAVLGLQMENIWRTCNVFRPAYIANAGIPLSKPRATLTNVGLNWNNVPCLKPTLLYDSVVNHFEQSSLYELEYFKDANFEQSSILERSYAFLALQKLWNSFGEDPLNRTNIQAFTEGQEILKSLLTEFDSKSIREGTHFMFVQLPNASDLAELNTNDSLHYEPYLNEIESLWSFAFLRTDSLLSQTPTEQLFNGHYTPLGNKLIATYFAERLEQYATLPKLNE